MEHPIVFVDGFCNICNSLVGFIMKRDPSRAFRFASLQGATAATMLALNGPGSVVLIDEDGIHERSTAALRILKRLGGIYGGIGSILLLIPRPLRDGVYRLVAANRYRLGGKRKTCRVPTAEDQELMLP